MNVGTSSESNTDTTRDGWFLDVANLPVFLETLAAQGYAVHGPQVVDGAIVLRPLAAADALPRGWLDRQDGGSYRLEQDPQAGYFDHVVGPQSLKPYTFPPTETILAMQQVAGEWVDKTPTAAAPRIAVLGVRSCDLHALLLQDRIFLHGPYQDPGYRARRENLLLIAVNCRRAAATCFCHSVGTGPRATDGYDLVWTELPHGFLCEAGSAAGERLCESMACLRPAAPAELAEARDASARLEAHLQSRSAAPHPADEPRPRYLETAGIRELLLEQPNHPHWQTVADRCLACANCTMVCPTCFCCSVDEVADLTGENVSRVRQWDSCFHAGHSRMSSGVVRNSTAARYRQWLTHKLASWIDQFGSSGCVGCGRCITWCPVGIDLTVEVEALREKQT